MGYYKHHVIVVTDDDESRIKVAHETAISIFSEIFDGPTPMVSEIVEGVTNDQYTFVVGPDGSKEGWEDSDLGDSARAKFVEYLKSNTEIDFVEVVFGGDYEDSKILNDNAYREE